MGDLYSNQGASAVIVVEQLSQSEGRARMADKSPSLLGGACIIACVCVGAGMLGLPAAGAGAWTLLSILVLVLTMAVMLFSGWLLLEVYQYFPAKVSFSSVTEKLLGKRFNLVNNLAVYFVGGILLYAYITSAGLIISGLLPVHSQFASILFVLFFSLIVWHSTWLVDKAAVVLIVIMIVSFGVGISGLAVNIDPGFLLNPAEGAESRYLIYTLPLLPVALASFGYHHSVSTMRDYYRSEHKAGWVLLGGVLVALVVYVVWMITVYGNLPRDHFPEIIRQGGNVDVLLKRLDGVIEVAMVSRIISAFSMAAILSSFIGVGIGVFDYIADAFQFDDTRAGRTKSWAMTFVPPLVLSLLFPFGFLLAIGYAAFAAALWTCITPALLVAKAREIYKKSSGESRGSGFRVVGGRITLLCVGLFGVVVMIVHTLAVIGVLPVFDG